MSISHETKGSVLNDLGFQSGEAKNLIIRASLMRSIEQYIDQRKLSQSKAAEKFGVSQPRISDLLNGKINRFSIDQLIKMHERVGINVALIIDDRLVA